MQTTNMASLNPIQGSTLIDPNIYFLQIKTWLEAGKALETITANQLQQAVGGSYQNALQVLEELDSYIEGERKEKSGLDFPFNMINQMHNAYYDAWRVMFGLSFTQDGAKTNEQAVELNEKKAELEAVQARLDAKNTELEQVSLNNEAALNGLHSDLAKAVKAKQTAQQNTRKAKSAHTALQKEHDNLVKQHSALTKSLKDQQKSTEKIKSEYEKLVEDMEAQSKHQIDGQRRHLDELNEELVALKQELATKNQQLEQQSENQN
ncbi:hypothetical protein [Photobacterium swingsii]|uniref:Uncharacterized protein n=1 Tax=Photobacterium swingsii TaxID=680026 RepID=A0A0J8VD03_9GAMM|nr:hypothetical protein [Photobacterium swingsii]KMV30415.1 hypothetical protein AB733_12185 [Photobacterium swingsii]PSW24406.1 hypothetical protein C9I94_10200 [Photobacterium swingsii]